MLDSKDDQIVTRFVLITIHLGSRCLMEFEASYVSYVLAGEIINLHVYFRSFLGKIN